MAVKKSELYTSLWASCDSLRGGMDSSQYKDYILTLLFVKYVSDKSTGSPYDDVVVPEDGSFDDMLALIGRKDIGEKMDIIISKLAEANSLRGVIDNAHFNDEDKLGKGKKMVDKLSELLGIFRDKVPDLGHNRADGDDIIGDAYEYLMRNFTTESGKSKGQFYTPSEVSRILARVIGIENARETARRNTRWFAHRNLRGGEIPNGSDSGHRGAAHAGILRLVPPAQRATRHACDLWRGGSANAGLRGYRPNAS